MADRKTTAAGEIIERGADGKWRVVDYVNEQAPADPTFNMQAPKTQADINDTVSSTVDRAADNAREDKKLTAELYKNGLRLGQGGTIEQIPGWKPVSGMESPTQLDIAAKESGQTRRANTVRALTEELRGLYDENIKGQPATRLFGATEGIIPGTGSLPDNQEFDAAGQNILPLIRNMIAQSSKEGDSNIEMQIFGSYIPKASDNDATIERKFKSLEILIAGMVDGKSPSQMRGSGDFQKGLSGKGEYGGDLTEGPRNGSVFNQDQVTTVSSPIQAAPSGSTQQVVEIPQQYKDAVGSYIGQHVGDFTPEAYIQFRRQLDQQFNFPPTDNGSYQSDAETIQSRLKEYKGGPLQVNMANPTREMDQQEINRNNMVNNPVGGAAAGFANAMSLGGVEAATGDQYDALRGSQSIPMLGGEIAGSVLGTRGISKLASAALKNAPKLASRVATGGGNLGAVGRALAPDVAYGTGYGTVTGQDPIKSAAASAVGSGLGQGLGKIGGAVISGIPQSEAVQRLLAQGVPVRTGQRLGGMARNIGERMESVPIVGDILRARNQESRVAGLGAAGREAGAPIGVTSNNTGLALVDDLKRGRSQAYEDATRGIQGPTDSQFADDVANIAPARDELLPDQQVVFNKFMSNRVIPMLQKGEMTGNSFQQTNRAISKGRAKPPGDSFEDEYRKAMTQVGDAVGGQMERIGGPQVARALQNANRANRSIEALGSAVKSAKANDYTPTPFQLQQAGWKAADNYPGPRPFGELADDMQSVLGSRNPNSGTTDRAAQMALLGGTGALGGAGGYAVGGDNESAATGSAGSLAALAVLSALATKKGQTGLNAALFGAPAVRAALRNAPKKAGISSRHLGSAMVIPSVRNP